MKDCKALPFKFAAFLAWELDQSGDQFFVSKLASAVFPFPSKHWSKNMAGEEPKVKSVFIALIWYQLR